MDFNKVVEEFIQARGSSPERQQAYAIMAVAVALREMTKSQKKPHNSGPLCRWDGLK